MWERKLYPGPSRRGPRSLTCRACPSPCFLCGWQNLFKDEIDPEQRVVLTRKDLKEKFNSDQDLIDMLNEHEKDVDGFNEQLDADPDAEITVRALPSLARSVSARAQGRLTDCCRRLPPA